MPVWLPRLTIPDLCVVLLTIGLCMTASRISTFADFLGRLFTGKRASGHEDSSADTRAED